jgi:hypothetical protein
MNQLIERFIAESTICQGHPQIDGSYFDKEKFAELIVRECVKESMEEIVSDELIAQENDPLICEYLKGNNQGIVDAVVRFRNHFGVES